MDQWRRGKRQETDARFGSIRSRSNCFGTLPLLALRRGATRRRRLPQLGVKLPCGAPTTTRAHDPQQTKASRASTNKKRAILKCSAEGSADPHGAPLDWRGELSAAARCPPSAFFAGVPCERSCARRLASERGEVIELSLEILNGEAC
jgi:hypothetical protein